MAESPIDSDGSDVVQEDYDHDIHENEDDEYEEDFDGTDEMSPINPSRSMASRRSSFDHSFESTATLDDDDADEEEPSNLNMCSAYTHVFADTLRSLAVILASVLAEFTSAVTSEVADATAAVVVSLLIMLSLLPLFGGMVTTARALQRVNQQILAEKIRQGQQGTMTEEITLELVDEDGEEAEDDGDPPRNKAVVQFV